MKLKRLSIQRQSDDTFAIVAKIEYTTGEVKDVILKSADFAHELQSVYYTYVHDEESLQTDIMYSLQEAS